MGDKTLRFLNTFGPVHKCCLMRQGSCAPVSLIKAYIPPEGTRFPQHNKEAASTLTNCECFGFPLDLGI